MYTFCVCLKPYRKSRSHKLHKKSTIMLALTLAYALVFTSLSNGLQ